MIQKVESKYVTIIATETTKGKMIEFWADGNRLGLCEYIPPQIKAIPQIPQQEPIYKPGDRIVIEKTKSPYLTVGRTYAVESSRRYESYEWLEVEDNRGKLITVNSKRVRMATEEESTKL